MQKDQMRKMIANDKEHFYTYSKDNLSGSFPLINETEQRIKAKKDSEARWLNPRGFDRLGKRTNWNEHPRKPDLAKMDELRYPHVRQAAETKAQIKATVYRPEDDGKPVFMARANAQMTFSHPDYFNTVFASGDSVTQEEQERRQKEHADFERKVVVDNKHFYVNTKPHKLNQQDKYRGMLHGQVTKVGLRIGSRRLTQLAGR